MQALLLAIVAVVIFSTTVLNDSDAYPPRERVTLLTDTEILDVAGKKIDTIISGQQIIIATPSFTTQHSVNPNFGCGKVEVKGDELVCVKQLPRQQNVEGDKLIGEIRFTQPAVSITQIKDKDGVVVHLSWIEGILQDDHIISPTVSWIPEKSGDYSITTFFWESVNNPSACSPISN